MKYTKIIPAEFGMQNSFDAKFQAALYYSRPIPSTYSLGKEQFFDCIGLSFISFIWLFNGLSYVDVGIRCRRNGLDVSKKQLYRLVINYSKTFFAQWT